MAYDDLVMDPYVLNPFSAVCIWFSNGVSKVLMAFAVSFWLGDFMAGNQC